MLSDNGRGLHTRPKGTGVYVCGRYADYLYMNDVAPLPRRYEIRAFENREGLDVGIAATST
jgi:hypothetical protein